MLSVIVVENLRAVTPFDPVDVGESAVPAVRRVSLRVSAAVYLMYMSAGLFRTQCQAA